MEEPQAEQPQPEAQAQPASQTETREQPASQTATSPKKPPKLIPILFVLLLIGAGVTTALAWKTTYLDAYLPTSVKEFFGRGDESTPPEELTPEEEPTPPKKPVAPKISSVKAIKIAETTATIVWTTDIQTTSQVEYGKTKKYGSKTAEDVTSVTSHSIVLTGLAKATKYHYRVRSVSDEGQVAYSKDYTFTTNDPMAGWKTYSGFGISFKYPKKDTLEEPQLTSDIYIDYSGNKVSNHELQDGYSIGIMFGEKDQPGYEEYTSKSRAETSKSDDSELCTTSKVATTKIGGKTAYFYDASNCASGYSMTVYFVTSDTHHYEIRATHAGEVTTYKKITEEIIHSIKFID